MKAIARAFSNSMKYSINSKNNVGDLSVAYRCPHNDFDQELGLISNPWKTISDEAGTHDFLIPELTGKKSEMHPPHCTALSVSE